MKKSLLLLLAALFGLVARAESDTFTMTGKAGNSPIELVLTVNYNTGAISGKYAYKSTLRKNGKKKSSYLYFSCSRGASAGDVGNATGFKYSKIQVKDSNGNSVETWSNVEVILGRGGEISSYVKTNSGKTFWLTAYY